MRKSFLQEVNGLRSVKMLTLTFDESHVSGHLPAWWTLGVKEYAAVYGWKYLNAFLKRLREYRKKAGQRWNYLGAVMELQESGMVHFHVLFFGKWIAPIAVLKQYWDGSKHDAGVDVAKGDSVKGSVRYVTKYITKMGEAASNPDHEYINSIIWFFGVRLYNLRHVRKGPVSEAKEKPEDKDLMAQVETVWDELKRRKKQTEKIEKKQDAGDSGQCGFGGAHLCGPQDSVVGANPEIGLGKLISCLERLKRASPSNVCRKRIVIGDEAHLPGDVEHLPLPYFLLLPGS